MVDARCSKCFYRRCLNSGHYETACMYIGIEGRRRPKATGGKCPAYAPRGKRERVKEGL